MELFSDCDLRFCSRLCADRVLEIFWIRRDWTLVRDIGLLADQVNGHPGQGDLETPLDLPADADLHQTAEQLNDIQAGLHRALAEQTRQRTE